MSLSGPLTKTTVFTNMKARFSFGLLPRDSRLLWCTTIGQLILSARQLNRAYRSAKPGMIFTTTIRRFAATARFGFRHITRKNASRSHPEAYVWYDELIISTSRIADPGVAAPAALMPPVDVTAQ